MPQEDGPITWQVCRVQQRFNDVYHVYKVDPYENPLRIAACGWRWKSDLHIKVMDAVGSGRMCPDCLKAIIDNKVPHRRIHH